LLVVNKHTIAKVIGASVVSIGTTIVVRRVYVKSVQQSIVGGIIGLIAHELMDAPLSDWVEKQL
jgi:hypothetical protein